MLRPEFADLLRAYKNHWWRLLLLQTLLLLGLSAVIGVAALLVQGNGAGLFTYIGAEPEQLESRVAGVATLLVIGIALVSVPFLVAGAAATAEVADRALAGRRARLWHSLAHGFARFLPVLGASSLGFLLSVAFFVATPLISLVGILGLTVTGVIAFVRRRKPDAVPMWPGWRTWGLAAIPFAWFGRVTARAVLMLPAAVLEPAGPLEAHRAAERAAAGRRFPILAVMAVAVIAAVAVSAGFTLLGAAIWGELGASLIGGIVQLVALTIPIVAAVALYRRAAGPSGRIFEQAIRPAPSLAVRPASPAMTRIASVTIVALVATMGVITPVLGAASPAAADPANAGQNVSFVVTSDADTLDAGELEAQQASCRAAGPACTVRAALGLAAEDAADGALSATIGFSADMTIALAGVLEFAPNAETGIVAGMLAIDGGGHEIVLNGGDAHQILSVVSEQWNLSITGLTFSHGYSSGFGGAVSAGVPETQLQSVLFDANVASMGGAAIFARGLMVLDSTFLTNRATGNNALGGAIRATVHASIVNSTFSENGIEDQFAGPANGGDIYSDERMMVLNSTFVNSKRGSLAAGAPSTVNNSLFTTNWSGGGFACSGPFTGTANLSGEGDTSCGMTGGRLSISLVGALDSTGLVPVFPLYPNGNPAIGAGVECPATDALGTARPATGCDLGAVEFSGLTALELEAIPSTTVAGTVTLRATVTSDTAATPQGSVTFTFAGVDRGTIALDDPGDANDDLAVAEMDVADLVMGDSYAYSAAFVPSGPFQPSSAGPHDYTVEPVQVSVDLRCSNPADPNPPAAPECVGEHWNIADTESIHLVATVVDDRAGSMVVALDAAGSRIVAGPEAVVAGEVTFVIPASAFDAGLNATLHAIYTSTDGEHVGVSPTARSLVVLRTPTVTMSGTATSGTYGDSASGTFTVTVSGAAGIPTGTVTVFGHEATLNASGTATLDLSALPVGDTYSLEAAYGGDSTYGRATSNTVNYQTTPAQTTTRIDGISPVAPRFGEAVTVTVTVLSAAPSSADAQGSVTLVIDGTQTVGPIAYDPATQDNDGETTVDILIPAEALVAGDHTLVAQFDGYNNFNASDSPLPGTAVSISRAPTATALVVAPTASVWGDQVTLTATVDASAAASIPTGTVEFSAGVRALGTATLTPCDLPNADGCTVASITVSAGAVGIGATTLTAEYQGATNFLTSSGVIENYVVSKATPTVAVTGAAGLTYGDSTTYTVTAGTALAKPVDGTVVVVTAVPVDSDPVPLGTVTLTDGSGRITVPTIGTLVPGAYEITASFAGDASFEAAVGTTELQVSAVSTDIDLDSISATTVLYGGSLDVSLRVTSENGDLEPEGDVVVTWMGNEVGRATLAPEHDSGVPGVRTVDIVAEFGTRIPYESWLTAEFVPAPGFVGSQLATAAAEERVWVTVTPLQTTVAVDATAVLGLPLEAVATVAVVGDDRGITPGGQITFLVIGSAGFRDVGPVALVNGQATLADALGQNPEIIVDFAGTWAVRATYVKDTDLRYTSISPNNTAKDQVVVAAGGAIVTVDAPAATEYGLPVVVHVEVAGAVTPTGVVGVQLPGAGNVLVSDEVVLVGGKADLTLDASLLTIGSHEFFVRYSSDGTLNSTSSAPFTITVGNTGSTTLVDTSSRVLELHPGIVGAVVQYTAHVSASVGTATGYVNFSRGSTVLGQAPVDQFGNAAISLVANVAWSGDIVAEFMPAVSTMNGSIGTLAHSWIQAPVTVTLQGLGSGAIGTASQYSAYVAFDWTQFEYLATSLRPPHAPSGLVTISNGDGTSCSASLIETTAAQSLATCNISFGAIGAHTLTASYLGDYTYAAGDSDPLTSTISRGKPVLELDTPNGETWAGLSTVPVYWSVGGPSDGTVTIKRGAAIVCTSASLVGSCDVAIPAYDTSAQGNRLTLEYGASALWNEATIYKSGTIVACIPFQEPISNPAGMATVSIAPSPTCGGGTGYLTTDTVHVSATPSEGYRIAGFAGGSLNGSQRSNYAASSVTQFGNGNAYMNVQPRLTVLDGQQVPFGIQANVRGACVPVRFKASGITDLRTAVDMLYWETPRNDCSPDVSVGWDNSVLTYIPSDAKVTVHYQDGLIPAHTKFYGWQGLAAGDPFAATATYTIGAETRSITANFGAVCYQNAPDVVQPSEGTIAVSLPEPNCTDPQTGKTGWAQGTRGTATLVDAVATTLQVVSTRGAILNGQKQWWDESRWLPERPVYFDGWRGDTGKWTEGATTTATEGDARRTSRTISFRLGERPFTISAAYGGCSTLSTQVNGDASEGVPGTITLHTTPNCPIGDGNATSRWFRTGTSVSLSTAATGDTLKFLGWDGFPIGSAQKYDEKVTFALNSDVTATASFGTNANCRPLTISTVPAGALTLDTRFSLGGNACAAMYGPTFYDQGIDGNVINIDVTPATAAAEGSQTVFAWTTNEQGAPAGSEGGISKIWSRTTAINELLYGTSAIIVYACEFVAIGARVHSPNGQIVPSAGAANISRESQSLLGDFVITQPANCSTGADPRSGYGGYAWTVGTPLLPTVVADPVAYRFTGWSDDVTGTGDTPDSPLALVGAGRAAQGDNYNYRVTANFDAICYKLSLPSDADKLEVVTAPNCPGMAASESLYLGGTPVVIHASDKDDTLFRNWVSGVDAVDGDPHWASVIMTSDKSVVPYYSSKSVGEQITQYGTLVGDSLAIGSKKMIGVASAAVSAYVKVLVSKASLVASGIEYIAQGLEYIGVHGAVIDGMKDASSAMTSMISMLWAPLDCITAWSAGGDNTAFYAAQNLIGSAVVTALSAGAQQQQAPPQTAFDKLKAQAAAAKEKAAPGVQAVSAIAAAKSAYDAAASGNIGLESSAYDAWASQNSVSVFSTCMANSAGGAITSVMAVAP